MGPMRPARGSSWLVVLLGAAYFILPLVATLQFSLQTGTRPLFSAYSSILTASGFWASLGLSLFMALAAVAIGLLLIIPAAYWAYLRAPKVRTWVEFLSILPFVVPPIVLVFGMVGLYGNGFGPLSSPMVLILAAYGVISMPYLFRSIDNGLRSVDLRTLTQAALSLGAGWPVILLRIVLPNLRTAILGGAFLVFALIMGEYAISSMLGFNTFGVYMLLTGQTRAHAAAALALISFALVWVFVGFMHAVNRGNITFGPGAR